MTKKQRYVRVFAAIVGTIVSVSLMLAAVTYVVASVYTSLNVPELAEPVRYDDEEMGIYCYYYEDTMECFAPGEDMDDSVPEDERYESAVNEL